MIFCNTGRWHLLKNNIFYLCYCFHVRLLNQSSKFGCIKSLKKHRLYFVAKSAKMSERFYSITFVRSNRNKQYSGTSKKKSHFFRFTGKHGWSDQRGGWLMYCLFTVFEKLLDTNFEDFLQILSRVCGKMARDWKHRIQSVLVYDRTKSAAVIYVLCHFLEYVYQRFISTTIIYEGNWNLNYIAGVQETENMKCR